MRYVRFANACELAAGEWDNELSEDDKKRIQRAAIEYCGGAQEQSKALKKKYKDNPDVLKAISEHENDSVASFAKEIEVAK